MYSRMHLAHQREPLGLENRLQALAKFPYFLTPPPRGRKPVDVDAYSMVECLRDITMDNDKRLFGLDDPEEFFTYGGPTRLFVAMVDAHVLSFAAKSEKSASERSNRASRGSPSPPSLVSPFSGFTSAMGLYLHSVLGIWNGGRPMSTRLLCRIIYILKRHLARDKHRLGGKGGLDRGFWFWRAFVGAMALATQRGTVSRCSPTPSCVSSPSPISAASGSEVSTPIDELEALEEWFIQAIRRWSNASNVKDWREARKVLSQIVWPANFSSEPLAVALWSRVVESRP